MAQEKPRSTFVLKLHQLLSSEHDPNALRWLSNDTFGITSIESQAKAALTPQWEFRSLSSFIRQLSYYSFKRLSDRRRSSERRSSTPALIVFTHPSGNFVRDDPSKTALIPRKLRARKSTAASNRRKSSTASSTGFVDEYRDCSSSPNDGQFHSVYDDVDIKPTSTHLSLESYQIQPWNALGRSSPRTIPIRPQNPRLPPASLRDGPSPFDAMESEPVYTRSYPSPISAPASFTSYPGSYYPQPQAFGEPAVHASQQPPAYYYTPSFHAGPSSTAYGTNELPPLRHITSGLIVPPSPPPEPYSQSQLQSRSNQHVVYNQPQPRRHTESRIVEELEERTPSPLPQPVPFSTSPPSMHHFDHRPYGIPCPPHNLPHLHLSRKPHVTVASTDYFPSPCLSPGTENPDVKPFYQLMGQDSIDYPMVATTYPHPHDLAAATATSHA
ncbi:hypothetical protein JCM21900_003052 [Sporobolomyces salmonicolor]